MITDEAGTTAFRAACLMEHTMRVLGATIVTAFLTQAFLAQAVLTPASAADYDYGPLRGTQAAPPSVASIIFAFEFAKSRSNCWR